MPGLMGLGVIRKLREKAVPSPIFVLATAYDQYAGKAFRLEALDITFEARKRTPRGVVGRAKRFFVESAAD